MGDTSRQEYLAFVSEFGTAIDEAKRIWPDNWQENLTKALQFETPTDYLKGLYETTPGAHTTGAREMTA